MSTRVLADVCVAGCKHTTLDFIRGLKRNGFRIGHCLTIDPETAAKAQVAGYYDLRPFLNAESIPFTVANKYSLKSGEDRQRILSLNMHLLLVIGWQRLIPEWWLEALPCGAFGMHGSSKPLPHGRGRSPMNWSLVTGRTVFYTHLFQYLPGVDDGPIAGVQTFDINLFDDCHTLHLKNTISMVQLCARLLPSILDGAAKLTSQPKVAASYWPKRSAEDGLIFWDDSTSQIYNLVRAVTHPFPGAFTYLDDSREAQVLIWRAIPFDTRLEWPGSVPGQVLEVFYDGSFVVRTGDSTMLVLESEGHEFRPEDVNRYLGSAGIPRKIWEGLPD
jgi:methionyl-tRNA formyltransferase